MLKIYLMNSPYNFSYLFENLHTLPFGGIVRCVVSLVNPYLVVVGAHCEFALIFIPREACHGLSNAIRGNAACLLRGLHHFYKLLE
jgi:hypothetical protein